MSRLPTHSARADTRPDPAAPAVLAASALRAGWMRLVERGDLVAEAGGVRFGVCSTPSGPVDFAESGGRREVGRHRKCASPEFVLRFSPARGHKPGAGGRLGGGAGDARPAGFEGDGRPCRFLEDQPGHPHSLCRREELARVTLGRGWAVLPNLSPYEPRGTFVVVPSPGVGEFPHQPQRLDRAAAGDLLDLAGAFDRHLGFFNAGACGASVNHLHLQLVSAGEELPLEKARVRPGPRGGELVDYPARGRAFDLTRSAERAALLEAVERLERRHPFYNLLVLGSRAWLFGRPPDPTGKAGFDGTPGAYELAGVILFTSADRWAGADPRAIAEVLRATTLTSAALDSVLA